MKLVEWKTIQATDADFPGFGVGLEMSLRALGFLTREKQLTLYLKLQNALAALALGVLRRSGPEWKENRAFVEFAWKAGVLERDGRRKKVNVVRLARDLEFVATLVAGGGAKRWRKAIEAGRFDYELLLCEFLLELSRVDLSRKIRFSKPETFFTEMGRRAFRQFIRGSFEATVRELKTTKVLDVGCGYGDHLEVLAALPESESLVGVERQRSVAQAAAKRFAGQSKVRIVHGDILEVELPGTFDLILLNYVTFYFSDAEKEKLFTKLAGLLSPGGKLLFCQYFPRVEHLQTALCTARGENTFQKRAEMFFGNRTLYAEVLLDESLDAFQTVDRWEPFVERLERAGLGITHLTNADPFYYSLFVAAGRRT